jgi:hypothetical protein
MKHAPLIASAILLAPAALAQTPNQTQDHSGHEQHQPEQQPAEPHAGHETAQQGHSQMDHGAGGHTMGSAFGGYQMNRDASGTSWVPDASRHSMLMTTAGDWMLMGHVMLDGVYSWQDGPRGDEKAFVGGMLMATAQRRFTDDSVLQFRAMLSPDPLMGKSGYPLLLAAGETADGVNTLVDRQHPHDLFMELSASYSHVLPGAGSVFVYAGLPGEPAFGPPAFMHRPAAEASPEAPITHHWLDSTHITFGVVTAGWVHGGFKLEASRFRGREPDQDRFDIETGELDSTAVRLSWNPSDNWALQTSWADVTSPEQLEPDVDVRKFSASILYTQPLGNGGELALTGAFARKDTSEDVSLEAWLGEASWRLDDRWTIFSRAEAIESDELGLVHPGPVENAVKVSLGASRDFRLGEQVVVAVGGLVSLNSVNDALEPLYDGDPMGAMAFVRLKVG